MRTRLFAALAAATAVVVMLALIAVYAARARQLATGQSDGPGTRPPSGTAPVVPVRGPDADLVAIEAAAVAYRSSGASGRTGGAVAVIDRRCQDTVPGGQAGCSPDPIPLDEQRAVAVRLAGRPTVRFVSRDHAPEVGRPDGPFDRVVTLGPVTRLGPHARIPYAMLCGPLCGYGTTLVLTHGYRGWTVTGETGVTWIS